MANDALADVHPDDGLAKERAANRTTSPAPGSSRSCFATPWGAEETFLVVRSDPSSFPEALAQLARRYTQAVAAARLSDDTLAYSRIFASDPANRAAELRNSPLFTRLCAGAVSVVGQAALDAGPLCLLSYHVKSRIAAYRRRQVRQPGVEITSADGRNSVLLYLRNYRMLWNAGFIGRGAADAYAQTQEVFGALARTIGEHGMSLLDSTVRTWVCIRDIDNNYNAMVRARREFFAAHGLTENTRYLASTGIEGTAERTASLVAVDALSIGGLQTRQISRMDALDHMPRTLDYAVTFERGLRVRFGDRSHLYVSGTASVDRAGAIMHPGNARAQTLRAIENVSALLATEGAKPPDLKYLLVYVRDANDLPAIKDGLRQGGLQNLPTILLHGAVCRPGWLVELEGLAIVDDATKFPVFD